MKNTAERPPAALVSRYYQAEKVAGFVCLVLMGIRSGLVADVESFAGISVDMISPVPALAIALFVLTLYLLLEWHQSSREARRQPLSRTRLALLLICVAFTFAISIPQDIPAFDLSRFWYICSCVIGLAICLSINEVVLIFTSIRPKSEAERKSLPRMPLWVKSSFISLAVWGAVICVASIVAYKWSPVEMHLFLVANIALCIAWGFIYQIGVLFFSTDGRGEHLSYAERKAFIGILNELQDRQTIAIEAIDKFEKTKEAEELRRDIESRGANACASQKVIREHIEKRNKGETSMQVRFMAEVGLAMGAQGEVDFLNFPSSGFPVAVMFDGGENIQINLRKEDMIKHANDYLTNHYAHKLNSKEQVHKFMSNPAEMRKFLSYIGNQATFAALVRDKAALALYSATHTGDWNVFNESINYCDINWQAPQDSWTVLLAAVANRRSKMAEILLQKGADANIPNGIGVTPLIYAARYDDREMIEMLLDYGADIDKQDMWGNTALAISIIHGNPKMAKFLMSKGADAGIKNKKGHSPLMLARAVQDGETARLIHKYRRKKP